MRNTTEMQERCRQIWHTGGKNYDDRRAFGERGHVHHDITQDSALGKINYTTKCILCTPKIVNTYEWHLSVWSSLK